MSPQVPRSATTSIYSDDKRDPDISMQAQGSTTLRSQSVDHSTSDADKTHPRIAIPSKAPPSTPALRSSRARNARRREDSRTSVSIAPITVDHSIREAGNEDWHRIPIQIEKPLPELPSIDRGDGAVQSTEARHEVPGLQSPTEVPTAGIEPCSVVCRDGDVPSITLFQGASNIQSNNATFITIGRDATLIRFGDGQFTDVQRNLICDYIANLTVLPDIKDNFKKHVLTQSIISLPRAKAVFDDYQNKKKSGPCFKGTREALLREMADWATTSSESRMYILSGLAGIGKSTVAYTIASRAADLNLLGASFFFSRDETDRKNAEVFFTTIAYQLCVYDEKFAKAIGDILLTERGSAAITKDPHGQLQALILEPLRSIVQSHSRPILIIVDALDECDEEDTFSILAGLSQLVRDLPSFKIILTTRPQPYLDRFLCSHGGHKIFCLQDIEDKVVDSDIRLYLNHSLSLKSVQERYPHRQWRASAEEIDSLVRAAGRLFIIASIAVRYIFDKSASNPAAQMQQLLRAFARYVTPFKDLDHFYTVILRNVVPENCDNDDTVNRYQSVVGAIIFLQRPLPVSTLAHLLNIDVAGIREVLNNLQSVILLGSDDVPRIYHKSFPDYLVDQARCKDPRLRIGTRICHIQIATRCFKIMYKHLKRNILCLGDAARFMNNEDGLKEDEITDEQIQAKIPEQLRYACVYWANHLTITNIEDTDIMNGLERFVDDHLLHWIEVLSLIGKLDLAYRAIGVVLKLLKSRTSNVHQLLSDAIRFIGKFYELMKRSALHTYYSALPFTPLNSLLYRRYIKEAEHNLCSIEGGPERWDTLVATPSHGKFVDVIKFSLDSTLFFSFSIESETEIDSFRIHRQGKLKIWNTTGAPISTIPGHIFAVANDFSTVASCEDKTITFYNLDGSTRGTMLISTLSKIENLALSSESSRVAAALSDGTIWLWDSGNAELIDRFDGFDSGCLSWLEFSINGTRLAYSSANGIKLRHGISGRSIADLQCESHGPHKFSGDGSRIASLSSGSDPILWNSKSGGLIANVVSLWGIVQHDLAITANGSLLTIADYWSNVTLWKENRNHLAKIKALKLLTSVTSMVFSLDNILAIGTDSDVQLYNIRTHSFIHTSPLGKMPLAFSPDCTRLAIYGDDTGDNINLWDIQGIDTFRSPSKETTRVSALALSRDCSRLACGFMDGTVELRGISPAKRQTGASALSLKMKTVFFRVFYQSRHTSPILALGFDPDGELFASGSGDGTIKLWTGGDGALRKTLKVPGRLQAVTLSNKVLVAGWDGGVTLWSLDTLSPIHTFEMSDCQSCKVSIAENSTIIAVAFPFPFSSLNARVTLLDPVNRTTIASGILRAASKIYTMTFLPDNSQLVVQSDLGIILSLDLAKRAVGIAPLEHLIQLPNTPLWNGIPIWHCQDINQHYIAALFPQRKSPGEPVPVLWIPRQIYVTAWAQGSSMIALGCKDGRVILLRLPTNHVS